MGCSPVHSRNKMPYRNKGRLVMKKLLLAGIAALSMLSASVANAGETKLPKTDPLIGTWCLKNEGKWTFASIYKRGTSQCKRLDSLGILHDGYKFQESGCLCSELKQLRDGWLVVSECGGEGSYWNDKAEFRIVGGELHYRVILLLPEKSSS